MPAPIKPSNCPDTTKNPLRFGNGFRLVEIIRIEPLTACMPSERSLEQCLEDAIFQDAEEIFRHGEADGCYSALKDGL